MPSLFINESSAVDHSKPVCIIDPCMSKIFFEMMRSSLRSAPSGFSIFYAVKCNPDREILKSLDSVSCNFEAASAVEFENIVSLDNVDPSYVPITNPILSVDDLAFLLTKSARIFVVDSVDQLGRLAKSCVVTGTSFNDIKVILRLAVPNDTAAWDLSDKFGLPLVDIALVSKKIVDYGFSFHGFSFHVGSQALSQSAYISALQITEKAVLLVKENGLVPKIIDVGGGFPIDYYASSATGAALPTIKILDAVVSFIKKSPVLSSAQLWLEPGRFLAAPSAHIITKIVGKAVRNDKVWMYALTGSYNGMTEAKDLKNSFSFPVSYNYAKFKSSPISSCVVTGPTCDSSDIYSYNSPLPDDMDSSDIIQYPFAGAYSLNLWSSFNGFPPPTIDYKHGVLANLYLNK